MIQKTPELVVLTDEKATSELLLRFSPFRILMGLSDGESVDKALRERFQKAIAKLPPDVYYSFEIGCKWNVGNPPKHRKEGHDENSDPR